MKKRGYSVSNTWRVAVVMILIPIVVGVIVWLLTIDKSVPVFNPQGSIAAREKELMLFTLLLSVIVVVPVFVMLGVFAWKYREGNHKAAYTPDVEGNRWFEALWWGIPILIIGILSVVTWVSTHELDPYKPIVSNVKPLKVQVVALQWRWLFIYPEQHIATINELVIPAGTPVNFELTADGPMSGFWIPSLGSQVYAMTGMSSKLSLIADNPGTFRGSNSNISGVGYADMNFTVRALNSRRDFDLWVKAFDGQMEHQHIDMTVYQDLARPSHQMQTAYYHLHDEELYTGVINKFMHGGSHTDVMSSDAGHGHDEGHGND